MASNKNCPPSSTDSFLDDFVKALQNEEVMKALGSIFENKLIDIQHRLHAAEVENNGLRRDLATANERIASLETYFKKSNLIITGVLVSSYAEAVSAQSSQKNRPKMLKRLKRRSSHSSTRSSICPSHRVTFL